MRKIFFIFVLVFFISAAQADIRPRYIDSVINWGIGFTSVQSPIVFKKEPDNNSKTLETVHFDYKNNIMCEQNKNNCEIEKIFTVYSTEKRMALLSTLDETEGYSYVCYNQTNPLCGWVENKNNIFYNWSSFIGVLGKKYGLYPLKNISKNDKILYASSDRNTNSLGSLDMPKYITPWLVQGNWVLVKVNDFNSKTKTGWLNFRGDDGKLRLFVNF